MNYRLQQFLSAENITQAQFADEIGVARAGVSHVLAGRNKPGFDFIAATAEHYPTLNIEWLITGKGKMYKGSRDEYTAPERRPEPVDPPSAEGELFFSGAETAERPAQQPPKEEVIERSTPLPSAISSDLPKVKLEVKDRHIVSVIALYDDGSYSELK